MFILKVLKYSLNVMIRMWFYSSHFITTTGQMFKNLEININEMYKAQHKIEHYTL